MNEERLKVLYLAYADAFPEYANFWKTMANEEQGHANIIRSWQKLVDRDEILFDNSRFAKGSISAYGEMIQNYLDELSSDIGPVRAINVTVGLEESLIENKFFEGWKSDQPEFNGSLEVLQSASTNHLERSKQMRSIIIGREQDE